MDNLDNRPTFRLPSGAFPLFFAALAGTLCCFFLGPRFAAAPVVIGGFHPFYGAAPRFFAALVGLPLSGAPAGRLYTLLSSAFFLILALLFLRLGSLENVPDKDGSSNGSFFDFLFLSLSFFYFSMVCSLTFAPSLFGSYDGLRLIAFLPFLLYLIILVGACIAGENGYWLVRMARLCAALSATAGFAGLTAVLTELRLSETLVPPLAFLRLFSRIESALPLSGFGLLALFLIQLLLAILLTAWLIPLLRSSRKSSRWVLGGVAALFALIFLSFGDEQFSSLIITKHWLFILFLAAAVLTNPGFFTLGGGAFAYGLLGLCLSSAALGALYGFQTHMVTVMNRFFVAARAFRESFRTNFGVWESPVPTVIFLALLIFVFRLLIVIFDSVRQEGQTYSGVCGGAYCLGLLLWCLAGSEKLNFLQQAAYCMVFPPIHAGLIGIGMRAVDGDWEGLGKHLGTAFLALLLSPAIVLTAPELGSIVMGVLVIVGGLWLFAGLLGAGGGTEVSGSGGASRDGTASASGTSGASAFASAYRLNDDFFQRATLVSSFGDRSATLKDQSGHYFTVTPHGRDGLVTDESGRMWEPE